MERVPEGVARFHPRPLLKYGDVPENPVANPPLFPPPPYSLAVALHTHREVFIAAI